MILVAMQPRARRIAGSVFVALALTLFGSLTVRLIEGSGEQSGFAATAMSGFLIGYSAWPNVERT